MDEMVEIRKRASRRTYSARKLARISLTGTKQPIAYVCKLDPAI